jgi:hypothetical protein
MRKRGNKPGVKKHGGATKNQIPPSTPCQICNVVSVTDPRFGARGDGATDDRNAIQAAIDSLSSAGGTVYFPLIKCAPTTYLIGTPGVPTPPLKYPSNVTFLGDYLPGVGRSTLRLCNDFRQLIFGEAPGPTAFWQLCVFAPANSPRFWGTVNPDLPRQILNVTFRNLALDGNRDNQPLIYTKSNHGLVPDPSQGLPVTAVEGVSTLTAGTYQFYVTYTDVNGVETNAGGAPGSVAIVAGQFARITLPPTPTGAMQVYAYVSESEYDAYGQEPGAANPTNLVYERQGPFAIPAGGTLDIHSHLPGRFYPPGIGLHIYPGESAYGAITIDSDTPPGTPPISNITIENCDIGYAASDAVTMVGWEKNIRINTCHLHETGLNGMSTGADGITGIYVTDTEFFGCDVGIDYENDVINLVRVTDCSFNKCGFGMSITTESVTTSDFVVDSCQFGDVSPNSSNVFLVVEGSPGRGDSIHFKISPTPRPTPFCAVE